MKQLNFKLMILVVLGLSLVGCSENKSTEMQDEEMLELAEEFNKEEQDSFYDEPEYYRTIGTCWVEIGHDKKDECSPNAEGIPVHSMSKGVHLLSVRLDSSEILEEYGIDGFSAHLYVKNERPKFSVGVYDVEVGHFASESDELPTAISVIDTNIMLPANVVAQYKETVKTFGGGADALPPYQLDSMQVEITEVEDIPFEEDSLTLSQIYQTGEAGRQLVKGSMTIKLTKLGPTGHNISPIRISFITDSEWFYDKDAELVTN